MKTVLITGGTGFVGSHLIEYLTQLPGLEVHTTSYGDIPTYLEGSIDASHIHTVDLTDRSATITVLKTVKPDVIVHLAAFAAVGSSYEQAARVLQNNIILQQQFLSSAAEVTPTARILAVSSAEVYGISEPAELPINELHPLRPINPYAVSKVAQDLLAYSYTISHKLDIVRVRPFNHIGERQTTAFAIPSFASQIVAIERGEQQSLRVGNLDAQRDITDVKDMVRAYWLLVEQGRSSEVYNVGTGRSVSMQNVVEQLQHMAKVKITVVSDPERQRPADIPIMTADSSKIASLGWQPTIELETSLERILDWWRQQ